MLNFFYRVWCKQNGKLQPGVPLPRPGKNDAGGKPEVTIIERNGPRGR